MPTTAERGLGGDHQRERRRLLPLAYGRPCPRCGELMLKGQFLDLDHVVSRCMGGIGGPRVIAHRRCNRSAGAKLGNRLRVYRRGYNGPERLPKGVSRW